MYVVLALVAASSISAVLAGCQLFREPLPYEVKEMMYNWLDHPPCLPPCWDGMTPGQTTKREALARLRQHPLVTDLEIFEGETPDGKEDGTAYWRWKGTTHEGGEVSYLDSTVYEIGISNPSQLLTFQDVIDAYGEPSHVKASAYPSSDGSHTVYRLDFVYLSQGFALNWSKSNVRKPQFGPEWNAFDLDFFEPTLEGFSLAWGGSPVVAENLVPWRGMLSFDDYCVGSRCD